MKNHKDLTVWQKSMDLAELVCRFVINLPVDQKFILSSQIQRAAIAIPSNIAEGAKRGYIKEYIQFLNIAYASASELETQMLLIRRLYPHLQEDIDKILNLNEEALKMLNKLTSNLKTKSLSY
jgi:four helix bundle protein